MSMMTVMLFLCFNVNVEHISHWPGVSIVDFEEINTSWEVFLGLKKNQNLCTYLLAPPQVLLSLVLFKL